MMAVRLDRPQYQPNIGGVAHLCTESQHLLDGQFACHLHSGKTSQMVLFLLDN
jgi:hypothetical protein